MAKEKQNEQIIMITPAQLFNQKMVCGEDYMHNLIWGDSGFF